ncbi:MAG: putative GOT1-membrane protein required for ER to Golgi transport [Piptocephalis tieghemiana]|nr:MAG: putative GOT1-membrane protein required for ER to Golgi transport [Piptocephalis tieghemiana]
MWELSDTQKIGAGLATFGGFFIFLGVLLLFDAGLIAIGNILFLSGLAMVYGLSSSAMFFAQKRKIPGTVCFFTGVLLVFFKWPLIGMCAEGFGFISLFGDFFPMIITFLRQLPLIGTVLNLPGISHVLDRITAPSQSPV